MNYIENIYICLAAPLLVAIICLRGTWKRLMISLLCGMTSCLLSSYLSTFFAIETGANVLFASVEIAPVVEECMKIAPVLFYLLVYEPGRLEVLECLMASAIGFATLENVCYLTQNGASHILHLLIRGFGTGAMHVVCGAVVGLGLYTFWNLVWVRTAGTIGIVALAIVYHGIFNMLVSRPGIAAHIGYVIPVLTIALWMVLRNRVLSVEKDAEYPFKTES